MSDVAICLPEDELGRLAADAPRHGHRVVDTATDADVLAGRLSAVRPALVVAGANTPYLSKRLVDACDAHGVRLVVVARSADESRDAAALGVVDALPGPPSWTSIASPLLGDAGPLRESAREEPDGPPLRVVPGAADTDHDEPARLEPPARGRIVAVWGPHGAPGRTSVAITLAAELAEAGLDVALADADSHAASIAPALGILDEAPGFAAACRLAGTNSFTRSEYERVAVERRGPRGTLRVLTGLGRPSRWPELTTSRIVGVLTALRDWTDVVVVDVAAALERDEEISSDLAAPRRNAATLTVLRNADVVLAVGAADPVGLARLLRDHVEMLEHVPAERVVVVANKLRAAVIGFDAARQVRQALERFGGVTDPVLVPWDPAGFDAALLSGRPLGEAAPRSPARAALRRLALEGLGMRAAAGRVR